jgi:salicylate 5-hydroxylase small subunit
METLFHAPYYQRHIVSGISITNRSGDRVGATANYVVFRTKRNELTDILNAGRYVDQVVRTPDGLRFAERLCIFDSEMIPNSLIYPI